MKYTLKQIYNARHRPESLLNKPFSIAADYSTWFFANFTPFSPNTITLLSLLFMFVGAYFYFEKQFLLGALMLVIRNVLDETDGRVARIKGNGTKIGPYIDNISSYFGTFAVIAALFCTGENLLIAVIAPFLTIMFFLFPLQNCISKLLLKKTKLRNHKNLLEFEDARIVGLIIIPAIFLFLPQIIMTEWTFVLYTSIILFLQQICWLYFYYSDFKTAFKSS